MQLLNHPKRFTLSAVRVKVVRSRCKRKVSTAANGRKESPQHWPTTPRSCVDQHYLSSENHHQKVTYGELTLYCMTADVVPSDYEKHFELRYCTSPQRRRSFVAYRIILRDFSPYVAVRRRCSASRINTSSSFSRCCPWNTSLPRRRHSEDNYVPQSQ